MKSYYALFGTKFIKVTPSQARMLGLVPSQLYIVEEHPYV